MTRFTEEWLAMRLKQKPATKALSPSKYGNVKTEVDGIAFDSKKESQRWQQLKLEEQASAITELKTQVPFAIVVNDILICQYIADFVYKRDGVRTVEDTKSSATRKLPVFRLKKRLMQAVLNIEIQEV